MRRRVAEDHVPHLERSCARYVEEMRGLAAGVNAAAGGDGDGDGAAVDLLDIVALNVRSEIVFGMFTDDNVGKNGGSPLDGCTSLGIQFSDAGVGHRGEGSSYIAQNWDWQVGQRDNLIILHISSPSPASASYTAGLPDIAMVTEAGIIGKIGLNAAGVGVCQNAIRARGVDVASGRLPVHLAMRRVLESRSRKEAVNELKRTGVAGSVYLLIGDGGSSGTRESVSGVECTSMSVKEMQVTTVLVGDSKNTAGGPEASETVEILAHTNHLILKHAGVDEPPWLEDSKLREQRIMELANTSSENGVSRLRVGGGGDDISVEEQLHDMLKDEDNYPMSINRHEVGESTFETLFTIVMNLTAKKALITFGRPSACLEKVELAL